MARPAGFEPTTPWFVARYSIQLSYGRDVGRIISEARNSLKQVTANGRCKIAVSRHAHAAKKLPQFIFTLRCIARGARPAGERRRVPGHLTPCLTARAVDGRALGGTGALACRRGRPHDHRTLEGGRPVHRPRRTERQTRVRPRRRRGAYRFSYFPSISRNRCLPKSVLSW